MEEFMEEIIFVETEPKEKKAKNNNKNANRAVNGVIMTSGGHNYGKNRKTNN